MFSFFRRFKNRYSASISVTISLGDYNMVKVSQYAPNYQSAKDLLITNLQTLGIEGDSYSLIIKQFVYRLFGRDFDGNK